MWRLLLIVGLMAAGASHLLGAPPEVGDSCKVGEEGKAASKKQIPSAPAAEESPTEGRRSPLTRIKQRRRRSPSSSCSPAPGSQYGKARDELLKLLFADRVSAASVRATISTIPLIATDYRYGAPTRKVAERRAALGNGPVYLHISLVPAGGLASRTTSETPSCLPEGMKNRLSMFRRLYQAR